MDKPAIDTPTIELLGLGGGCHWCTEAVFQHLRGVQSVEQGFVAAEAPDDDFSEAVRVTVDTRVLPLEVLIDVHLRTHASTSLHAMRQKYRSAVYVQNADQAKRIGELLTRLQAGFDAPLITRILQLRSFKPSDERYRNYYARDPSRPFCRAWIDPKLQSIRRRFGRHVR